MMDYGYMGYYGMGVGWIFQLLFFVVFFLIVYWLIKSNEQKHQDRPMDILRRRLASGEISKKQYEELRKEIE